MNADPTYSGLRQEMTQTFYAFRQLISAEYAAYAYVLVALLQAARLETMMLFDCLLAGLVIIVTLLGRSWFLQAVRQGSYLLAAFELPARNASEAADAAAYWILANRSFSLYLSNSGRDTFHFPSRELQHFLIQQTVLGAIAGIVVGILTAFSTRQFSIPFCFQHPAAFAISSVTDRSGLCTLLFHQVAHN